MSDDYEPAIEPDSTSAETSVESAPVEHRSAAPAAERVGEPAGDDDHSAGPDQGPSAPRRWNPKSRALFQSVVKQAGGQPVGDDLEPMEHAPARATAPASKQPQSGQPSAPAPSDSSAAAPAQTPAAALTPPPGLPELPDLPLPAFEPVPSAPAAPDPKHAEREQAIAAREAALVEREKLLPDRRAIIEDPAGAMMGWLKDTYGITSDDDLKTAVADLITDLSVKGLKIGVPEEHVNGMNSRRATRVVRVYASDVEKRERALKDKETAAERTAAEQRAKATAQQQEAAYVAHLDSLIKPAAGQYKFLHDPEVTGGLAPAAIVYEVLKEQKRLGQKPDLATATKYADDYYRAQAEQVAKRASHFQSLLAPAAPSPAQAQPAAKPAAPAPAPSASPGGAPGPAPTQEAKPTPERAWDPSDLPMDRQQRRAASLAKIVARTKAGAQPNT